MEIENIEIDGQTYKLADLSSDAKLLIEEIQNIDSTFRTYAIEQIKLQGSRQALVQALRANLPQQPQPEVSSGDQASPQ